MGIAEGYTLELVCDYCPIEYGVRRDSFYGINKGSAYKEVREAGWKTYPAQQLAKCPRCFIEKRKRLEPQKEQP